MAEYLGDALFELRANVAPLRAGMLEAEGIVSRSTRNMQGELAANVGSFSRGLGNMGHQLTRTLTFPILGIGVAAGKMAIDFQAAMENIHTQAGASQKEVDLLSKKVLALAKTVPYGPTPLADALYHLESIGLRLTKSMEQQGLQVRKQIPLMQVLKTAAEGAAIGHSDLEQTTTALGSAWLSGIKGATNLKTAMGTLNAIVGTGNMRMQDLVSALGTGVLPMAKLAGLGFKDVGAALAIMSDEGYNVSSAATQMGTALHYLFDPTQKAAGALEKIGLHSGALASDMHKPKGLLVALTDLKGHLDKAFPPGSGHALTAAQTAKAVDTFGTSLEQSGVKGKKLSDALDAYKLKLKELGSAETAQEAVLGDIFPAGRGRVLLVLMNQLANYQAKLKQINTNEKQFGADQVATHQTAAYKIHRAWASIQSDLTSFGQNVLPPLLDGVKGVADEIGKVGKAFESLDPQTKKMIITGGLVVAAIGPAMRIASFFMGGVSKLLAAATIAGRLAMGKGFKESFGGPGTSGGTPGASSLADIAEMQVNQMIVAELIAKNIPGVGGTGSRVPRASGVSARTSGGSVATAEVTAPSVPEGYVYDPMLGRNIRVAGAKPSVRAVTVAEATRSVTPTVTGAVRREIDMNALPIGLPQMEQRIRSEVNVLQDAEMKAITATFSRGSKYPLTTQLAIAGGKRGTLTAAERFAQAYPQGTFAPPRPGIVTAEREAEAMAEARAKSLGPGMVEKAAMSAGSMAGAAGSMAMRVLGGLGFVAMLAPLGIALGAAVHGWIQHQAAKEGNEFATKFLSRFPEAISKQFHAAVAKAVSDQKKAEEEAQARRTKRQVAERGTTSQNPLLQGVNAAQARADQKKIDDAAIKLGDTMGKSTVAGLQHGVAFSAKGLEREFTDTLGSVGAQAMKHGGPRAAEEAKRQAGMTMIEFAGSLEAKGKLSSDAVARIMKRMEREIPGFSAYLASQGIVSDKGLAKALTLKESTASLKKALQGYRQQFSDTQGGIKITNDNIVTETGRAMKHLADEINDPTTLPAARRKYIRELNKLKDDSDPIFKAMSGQVSRFATDLKDDLQTGGAGAATAVANSLNNLTANIAVAMQSGVLSSQKGGQHIGQAVVAVLKAYGTTHIPQAVLNSLGAAESLIPNPPKLSGQNMPRGHAGGGLIQVGHPGERGPDSIPMNVGGTPIVVGRGEQVAVFNNDQQRFMNHRLADVGGLPGMFGRFNRPHSERYAGGGIVTASQYGGPGDPGTGSVGYKGDNLYQHPDTYAELNMGTALGHLPYMTPLMVGYHGKSAKLLKRDIGAGGPGIGGHPRAIDLWFQAAAALGFSGLDLVTIASQGTANVNIAGGGLGGGAGVPQIKVPRISGRGTAPDIARGVMKMETKAANDFISRNVAIGLAAGGTAVPIKGLPGGFGSFDGFKVASWIVPILEWARKNGWGGHITSGYRPEHGSEHALSQYPGGAVDVGFNTAIAQGTALYDVLQKYPGKPNLLWGGQYITGYTDPRGVTAPGGHDYGHFSGTGRALGGFVEDVIHAAGGMHTTGASLTGLKAAKAPKKSKQPTFAQLTKAYNSVMGIEGDLTDKLGQYQSVSSRYSTDEGQAQYLNDDGSLNAAGIAKKTQDDQDLLGRAQAILADYNAELGPVSQQLKDWLGAKSTTQSRIDSDNAKLKPIVAQIAGLAPLETALSKPMKDEVTPLLAAIAKLRHHWDPIIEAATNAESRFKAEVWHEIPIPAHATKADRDRIAQRNKDGRAGVARDNATKRGALRDAITIARSTEENAINPLNNALDAARQARHRHADQVKASRFSLRTEKNTLEGKKKHLTDDISSLKAILTGKGGELGEDKRITELESVGGKLGTLEWDTKTGKFLGIDTKNQGAAYDEQTTIDSLKITLGQDAGLVSTSTDSAQALADAQKLADLWQNIAIQKTQADYVRDAQIGVMQGMPMIGVPAGYYPQSMGGQQLPPYAGSFATGGIVPGPIGAPRTAIVHGQEQITPPSSTGGNVHLHFANGMDWLKDYVSASVEDSTRGMARRAARMMPSAGGGIVMKI